MRACVFSLCVLVLPAFKLEQFGVQQGVSIALSETPAHGNSVVVKKVEVDLTEMPHLDLIGGGPPRLWYTSIAGREHHRFLAYMSTILPKGSVLVDLGTSGGLSAYAMSKNTNNQVYSFDFGANNLARNRGMSTADWKKKVPNLETVGMDLNKILQCTDVNAAIKQDAPNCVNAKILLKSQFMLLDAGSNPSQKEGFENTLVAWLRKMKYTGMLMRSNIYIDGNFRKWWKDMKIGDGVQAKHDVSEVGHSLCTLALILEDLASN
jgi:hypothetical protein